VALSLLISPNPLEIYGSFEKIALMTARSYAQMVLYYRSAAVILKMMANAVFFNNGHAYSEFIRSIWLSCIADLSSLRPE